MGWTARPAKVVGNSNVNKGVGSGVFTGASLPGTGKPKLMKVAPLLRSRYDLLKVGSCAR